MHTLKELYNRLEKHDWFYEMSDDHRCYTAGKADMEEMRTIAESLGTEGLTLFMAYTQYIYSGPAFGTERLPKPECPSED